MDLLLAFAVLACCLVYFFNSETKELNKNKKLVLKEVEKLEDFKIDKMELSKLNSQLLALDKERKKIALIKKVNEKVASDVFNINEILGVELQLDGEVISRVSNKSMLGRAAIGGILFGGVGAVIGGVTAKQKKGKADSIKLRFVVNDIDDPFRYFEFNTIPYEEKLEEAKKWQVILSNILTREGNEVETETTS